MLEEKKKKDGQQTQTFQQRPTVPSESDDIDWDVPPPYEQSFGNDQRNASTAVLGTSPF